MTKILSWSDYDGVLFDLDGVLTPTANVHQRAWTALFADYDFTEDDYLHYVDGKPRYDGVRSFLAARGHSLPDGLPSDEPGTETVCALGNAKNVFFNEILDAEGITPYDGSVAFLDALHEAGVAVAVVSSSRNAGPVLEASGLADRFKVVVDGVTAAEEGFAGKPAPDGFLRGAELLGVDPTRTIVVEDAVSGVAAGAAGGFAVVLGVDRGAGTDALLRSGATHVVDDLGRLLPPARTVDHEHRPVPTGLPQHRFPTEPWRLVEVEYGGDDLGRTETLFAVGNGYLGMRANPEEGRDAHSHGTFLNGFHETWDIEHAEDAYALAKTGQTVVNVPDAKTVKLYVDDEPLLLSTADLESYERAIDFRSGVLSRDVIWCTPGGKRVRVKTTRMVSFVQRHLAAITFEITMLDGDAPVVVSSQLLNRQDGEDEYLVTEAALGEGADPRKGRKFGRRVLEPRTQRQAGNEVVLGYRTMKSRMTMACGVRHILDTACHSTMSVDVEEDRAKTVFSIDATEGEPIRITKLVAYHSSTGVPTGELADRCSRTLARAEADGLDQLRRQQRHHLDQFWETSDIELDGDDQAQQAFRWNMFQLAQATARTHEQGIGAKGVTGGGYEGHYFWDTEIYVIPYLAYANPEAARRLLRFRWKMLDAARTRARELSQAGALYPWRTINGAEASAYYAAGTAQYHINAAVVFAIKRYLEATNDTDFLVNEAAEILVETARLWADLGFFAKNGANSFHIHRVTGPDEYTTVVNDNTYTNVMAQLNLRYAARTVRQLAEEHPEQYEALRRRTTLRSSEVDDWDAAADAMHIPYDEELGIHPQDTTFLNLEPWPNPMTDGSDRPLLLHYHPLVIYRHQVLKQADVVLAMFLHSSFFSEEQKRRNFDYYDPITTGDSSLSACVQSIVAAGIGRAELADSYFHRALWLDLCDTHHNTAEGVHIASAGGVWAALVHGFAGMTECDDHIRLDPRLPPSWDRLAFRLRRRGSLLHFAVDAYGCDFTVESGESVRIFDGDDFHDIAPGTTHRVASTIA